MSQKVGYIRVSTVDQNTARQLDGIELDRVYEDKVSGKNKERPALKDMLDFVREGDVIYVHSLDRLARNLDDLRGMVTELTNRGIEINFLKENLTFKKDSNAMSQLLLSVMGAFAEFERNLILERQREGIAIAKANGAYKLVGRKPISKTDMPGKVLKLRSEGMAIAKIAKKLDISRPTIYKIIKDCG